MRSTTLLVALLLLLAPALRAQAPSAPAVNAELLVTTEWLAERLSDPMVVLLHVGRDPEEYAAGHIPGARFLPLGSIVVERDGIPNELPPVEQLVAAFEGVGVSDGSHVVLYGDLGGLSAGRAFFTLDYLGHPRASLLDGGLEVWRAESRPLAREAARAARGRLTPRVRGERLATLQWIGEHLADPGVVLIDARPPAEYAGEVAGGGVPRAGHIPGAHNIFWRTALLSEERPLLREPAELRRMFEAAGARPGRTVVTYCRTGVQASHAYFVARYLGYEAKMFDGSFIEYSQQRDLPVAR